MKLETIFADFNNADALGRIRLNTYGSLSDIQIKQIQLSENMEIWLDDSDGLRELAIVKFSNEENIWVAEIH